MQISERARGIRGVLLREKRFNLAEVAFVLPVRARLDIARKPCLDRDPEVGRILERRIGFLDETPVLLRDKSRDRRQWNRPRKLDGRRQLRHFGKRLARKALQY